MVQSYEEYENLAVHLALQHQKQRLQEQQEIRKENQWEKISLSQVREELMMCRIKESNSFFNNLQWSRDWEDVLWELWKKESALLDNLQYLEKENR